MKYGHSIVWEYSAGKARVWQIASVLEMSSIFNTTLLNQLIMQCISLYKCMATILGTVGKQT